MYSTHSFSDLLLLIISFWNCNVLSLSRKAPWVEIIYPLLVNFAPRVPHGKETQTVKRQPSDGSIPHTQHSVMGFLSHWNYGAGLMILPVKSHYNYEKYL